jgi:hypothetical protein
VRCREHVGHDYCAKTRPQSVSRIGQR